MKTQRILIIFIHLVALTFCNMLNAQPGQNWTPLSFDTSLRTINNSPLTEQAFIHLIPIPAPPQAIIDTMIENWENDISNSFAIAMDTILDFISLSTKDSLHHGILHRLRIHSAGALSMNLVLDSFLIPTGALLWVYNPSHDMVLGAYTFNNNDTDARYFVIEQLDGDLIVMEYFEPYLADYYGILRIGSISYDVIGITVENTDKFGQSAWCHIDVNCTEGVDWTAQKRAVVKLQYRGARDWSYCTGVLLNNEAENGKPYILSARHCFCNEERARTIIAYFNYEKEDCHINVRPKNYSSISGAKILVANGTLDYVLLELNQNPRNFSNVYYSGWDRNLDHDSGGALIHHPQGDLKKISIYDHEPQSEAATCDNSSGTFCNFSLDHSIKSNFYRIEYSKGISEQGSSGAPLFNSNGRVIGTNRGQDCIPRGCGDIELRGTIGKFGIQWNNYDNPYGSLQTYLSPTYGYMTINGKDGCPYNVTANKYVINDIMNGENVNLGALYNLTAVNTVNSGATAVYSSGEQVILETGFEAEAGSDFVAQASNLNCIALCPAIDVNQLSISKTLCSGDNLCISSLPATNVVTYQIKISPYGSKIPIFQNNTSFSYSNRCVWNSSGAPAGDYWVTLVLKDECGEYIGISFTLTVSMCKNSLQDYDKIEDSNNDIEIQDSVTAEHHQPKLIIYPNPSNNEISITIENIKVDNPIILKIFSSEGKEIIAIKNKESNSFVISKLQFGLGLFFVQAFIQQDYFLLGKFLIL